MAYVLGFFAADGCMLKNERGGRFVEFHITDKDILEKIKKLLGSENKISVRDRNVKRKKVYRLQLGSKTMFEDLLLLGMTPRKSKTLKLPSVPQKYFKDFVRGYFDGDGNVYANEYQRKGRKKKSRTLLAGFVCGSKVFLEGLKKYLADFAGLRGGTLHEIAGCYRLYYSVKDSCKLYGFMYNTKSDLFLSRKKEIFEKYFKKQKVVF